MLAYGSEVNDLSKVLNNIHLGIVYVCIIVRVCSSGSQPLLSCLHSDYIYDNCYLLDTDSIYDSCYLLDTDSIYNSCYLLDTDSIYDSCYLLDTDSIYDSCYLLDTDSLNAYLNL